MINELIDDLKKKVNFAVYKNNDHIQISIQDLCALIQYAEYMEMSYQKTLTGLNEKADNILKKLNHDK